MKNLFRWVFVALGLAFLGATARANGWVSAPPGTANSGGNATVSASFFVPPGYSAYVLGIFVQDPGGTWHTVGMVGNIGGTYGMTETASGNYTFGQGGGTYVWRATYKIGSSPDQNSTLVASATTVVGGMTITAATIASISYNGTAQMPSAVSSVTPSGATVTVSASASQTNAGTYNTGIVSGTGSYSGTLTGLPWTITKISAGTPTVSASANPVTSGNPVTITPGNGTTGLYAWLINGVTVATFNGSSWSAGSGSYAGGTWYISGLNLILTPSSATNFTVNFQDTGNGNYNAATSNTLTVTVNTGYVDPGLKVLAPTP